MKTIALFIWIFFFVSCHNNVHEASVIIDDSVIEKDTNVHTTNIKESNNPKIIRLNNGYTYEFEDGSKEIIKTIQDNENIKIDSLQIFEKNIRLLYPNNYSMKSGYDIYNDSLRKYLEKNNVDLLKSLDTQYPSTVRFVYDNKENYITVRKNCFPFPIKDSTYVIGKMLIIRIYSGGDIYHVLPVLNSIKVLESD